MCYFARLAYVNRKNEDSPVIEGFLEKKYIPTCCNLNYDMVADRDNSHDRMEYSDQPDVYTLTYIRGSQNRTAELVFCVEKNMHVDSIYVEDQIPVTDADMEWVNKTDLICCNFPDDSAKDFYVFPQKILDDIRSSIGELDVYLKSGNDVTVIKVHIFPDDDELYRNMISELSELSTALVKGWSDTNVLVKAEGQDAVKCSTEDSESASGIRRYINTPTDAEKFLSELKTRISVLQNHAETDLRQVYKKMPIRKAKHITPKTLIEYNSTKSPKVNVLTVEEHYDIYEHRMIKQYLLDFKENARSQIRNSNKRITEYKENQKEVDKNLNEVINSFQELWMIENRGTKIQDVRKKLTDSREEFGNKIKKEKGLQKEWNGILKKLDSILEKYPILQVNLRGEKMHSSMLFLRNRYYRSVFEMIQTVPMVHIYKSANAMPAQKLFTLYERWCYFKIVSIFLQKYDFEIYAFSTKQGKLTEENKRTDDSLTALIQSTISDVPYPTGKYINIVLKKTGYENQFVKIEYQRIFGDPESKEKYGHLIPDFCITFGEIWENKEEHIFDISGPVYILDSKFKKYSRYSIYHEIFYVCFLKYIIMIKEIERVDIAGAYILHPNVGNENDSGNINVDYIIDPADHFHDTIKECYGRDAKGLYNKYSSFRIDEDYAGKDNQINEVKQMVDERIVKIEVGFSKLEANLKSDMMLRLRAAVEGEKYIEKYSWKSFDHKIGSFGFIPGVDGYLNRLFRMILEWESSKWVKMSWYSDTNILLVWNKCLLCGTTLGNDDIIEGSTQGNYTKYHLTCPNCGEFWVKSHCGDCSAHPDLIKHTPYHNYLCPPKPGGKSNNSYWYVRCPNCGN